jgi:hypothetical protein
MGVATESRVEPCLMPASTPISKNDLSKWFIKQLDNQQRVRVECTPEFSFTIDHLQKKVISDNSDLLRIILEKSGFYHLEIGFNPSLGKGRNANYLSSVSQKIETFNDYDSWLMSLFKKLQSVVFLAPDTNFIKRQIYSNFLVPKREYSLIIPRLVILEVENQYNMYNAKITPKNKSKANKDDAQQKIRESYLDMTEILKMQEDGQKVIPFMDKDLLQTFSSVTGKKLADSWIRMEVKRFDDDLKGWQKSKHLCIFLSCDLMNTMAANAEGLNTLYFYTTDKMRYDKNLMSNLLINTAVSYEKCTVYSENSKKICDLMGIWTGKNPGDWKNEVSLIFTEI